MANPKNPEKTDKEVNIGILKELGLTESEIKVYCLLIEMGQLNVSKISKETELDRSNLYRILERLISQKLVSGVISEKKKCFKANNPSILKEILNQKIDSLKENEKKLASVIENLASQKPKEKSNEFDVQIYSGKEELKNVLKMMLNLKKGETTYAFGCKGIFKHLFDQFWEDYKTKRANKGVLFKGVLSIGEVDPKRPHHKNTYVRVADLKHMTNVRIDFFHDIVVIFITDPNNPNAILIKNKEIAKAMKTYFDFLWEKSGKTLKKEE